MPSNGVQIEFKVASHYEELVGPSHLLEVAFGLQFSVPCSYFVGSFGDPGCFIANKQISLLDSVLHCRLPSSSPDSKLSENKT